MEWVPRLGSRAAAAAVLVVLVAGCCMDGAQATSVPLRPAVKPGVHYPYYCPKDVTLTKLQIRQGERGYVQHTEYATKMPTLTSFTMHYWFNLDDARNTATMFNYESDPDNVGDNLTVQLEHGDKGHQYWAVHINGKVVSRVLANPPIYSGQWYHALHSWNSYSGVISHFVNGNLVQSHTSYEAKNLVIPGKGRAVSGQHQNTLFNGMDQGEGLNGWFTLFHLSAQPLSSSIDDATTKARLASQCSADVEGDVISWITTPRKGYGGVTETPSYTKACGQF